MNLYKLYRNFVYGKQLYPQWKSLVPKNPTKEEFEKAWFICFEEYIEECRNIQLRRFGTYVESNYATILCQGYDSFTDAPETDVSDFDYKGYGCTWLTDKNGLQFYLLDCEGMPVY